MRKRQLPRDLGLIRKAPSRSSSSGITVDANYNTRNNEIILLRAAREPADFLENFFNRACERNAFINDGTTLREELGSWD